MNIFQLKTKVRRYLVHTLKINRPTSYPFITGDGFRALAQHIFDENSDLNPKNIEKGDIVFVRNDYLKEFFTEKHPQIENGYILISHNHDTSITEEYTRYLDDKIIHWFARNLLFKNEKITPIPIGVTNYYYQYLGRGKIFDLQKNIVTAHKKISDKISFAFATSSNSERTLLKEKLIKNPLFENIETTKQSDYFQKMSDYEFAVSPEGYGLDCHRTWEALYLKVIPIVKKRYFIDYFNKIGVPFLIIDTWEEMLGLNKDFLIKKYSELEKNLNNPALFMDFWIKMILDKRK